MIEKVYFMFAKNSTSGYNKRMFLVKKNLARISLLAFMFVTPAFTLYAVCIPSDGKICNPIAENSISGLIKTLLSGVLRIGIPVIALAIIYCGFLFVSARGKPEALTKAKDALLYTLIGSAILLGSWAIAQLISNTVLAL